MITWPSRDDHATTRHLRHLIGRSPSQWTWALRVPTLVPLNLFLSYCMLMLLWLLCSHLPRLYAHSRLRPHLYVPLCPIRIPLPSTSMRTAALVTNARRSPFR